MFVDEIKVYARAGHGGKGAVAFHREAFVPKGGPSGGNGGRGGSVILQADHDLNNLLNQYYTPRLVAEKGEGGMGKGMDGLAGKDLIVKVPCGTLVWQLQGPDQPELAPGEKPGGSMLLSSSSRRPLLRSGAGASAFEFDVSEEAALPTPSRAGKA